MNKSKLISMCLVLLVFLLPPALNYVTALPPLSAGTFPTGTIVIPMDNKQADRVHVYGLIHEFLRTPGAEVSRIIEPPDVSMNTALTPSGAIYQGGPFLIDAKFRGTLNSLISSAPFTSVIITQLTTSFTSDHIFFVTQPTHILVIRGVFGRTDLTLSRMGINYTIVDPSVVEANPSIIDQYTLVIVDCPGWFGNPSGYTASRRTAIQEIYDTIEAHVRDGNEVVFTDIALKDMNVTFPGYVHLAPGDSGSWQATVYNPPKGNNFSPEFPSQYYNPGPNPNSVKIFTEGGGWVVSSIAPSHQSDVRVVMDSNAFGTPHRYAILGFYFQYGNGIVEALAFHPQQQLYPTYADQNGYYAVYELYGDKFVHGPQRDFIVSGSPSSQTISQGQAATYSITVTSIGRFSSPVNLQVTGEPPNSAAGLVPIIVTPPPDGGTVTSTLTVQTAPSTPIGSYNLTITGTSTFPTITRSVTLMLIVQPAISDFAIDANPKAPNPLIVNLTQCGNISITVRSLGNFSLPVNLTLSTPPSHVTSEFIPNPVTPPASGSVGSTLRFCVASNAAPGNYSMTVSGTATTPGGPLTHTVDVLLRVPTLAAPSINPLIYLIVLVLLLLALAIGLLAILLARKRGLALLRRRPRVLYVLPLPTVRCRSCGRVMPLYALYCPYCGRAQRVMPRPPAPSPARVRRWAVTRRGLIGFSLALISGILVILNGAALLAPSFYGPPVNWSGIFWWLPSLGVSNAFMIGFVVGVVLVLGSVFMLLGQGVLADIIIFPFAVFSLIIGGGFLAGMVLGILGGVIGALRK